jgi:hypothetical protein
MTTLKQVNKKLAERGHEFELVKGNGYFYFAPTGKDDNFGPTVYVCYLYELSVDRWVQELEDFLNKE